jgi:hypothetical protein
VLSGDMVGIRYIVLVLLLVFSSIPAQAKAKKNAKKRVFEKIKLELKKSNLDKISDGLKIKQLKRIKAKGSLYIADVIVEDTFEEQIFFKNQNTNKGIRVHFLNDDAHKYLLYKEIKIKGFQTNEHLFVTQVSVNENSKRKSRNLRSKTLNVATVRVSFKDKSETLSKEQINNFVYGGKKVQDVSTPYGEAFHNSTKETLRLLSKGNMIITGSVIADITIDSSFDTDCNDDDMTWREQIYSKIEELGLSSQFNAADYRIFSLPFVTKCRYGGLAFQSQGDTIVINDEVTTFTHELGHLLGMAHASSHLSNEEFLTYGDFSDVMGSANNRPVRDVSENAKSPFHGSHSLNAPHRVQMGFLDSSKLLTLDGKVDDSFTISSLDLDDNSIQAIKIVSLNEDLDYYLSFRTFNDQHSIASHNEYKLAVHTASKDIATTKNLWSNTVLISLLDPGSTLIREDDDLEVKVESIDFENNKVVVRILHKSNKTNLVSIKNNNIHFNWSGKFNEKWLYGSDGLYFIMQNGDLRKWYGGSKETILENSALVANYGSESYANLALLPGVSRDAYDSYLASKNLVLHNNKTYYNSSKIHQERWLRSGASWYFILPNGFLYKWDGKSKGESIVSRSKKVEALGPELYSSPYLFKTITKEEYFSAMNFRVTGSLHYNWGGSREKWFYSNEGWCFIKSRDRHTIHRWHPSSGKRLLSTPVANVYQAYFNISYLPGITDLDFLKTHMNSQDQSMYNSLGKKEKWFNGIDQSYAIYPNGTVYISEPGAPLGEGLINIGSVDVKYYTNPALFL